MNEYRALEVEEFLVKLGICAKPTGRDTSWTRVSALDQSQSGDLVFVENPRFLSQLKERKPAVAVIPEDLQGRVEDISGTLCLFSSNVRLAHALVKQKYADRELAPEQWQESQKQNVHPTAVVHESVQLPSSCQVGPRVVIGRDVVLGEECQLMAGAVVEHSARLGNGCVIFSNAVVGSHSVLGNEVEIGMGSVIGSEGFGFAQDSRGQSYRLPQTGTVVLEDRVRLGANCCVDRAAYGETRIGQGTKMDNLCHVAHGVSIGKDCLMAAGFAVAGSTTIGDRVMASGQTGVLDHLTVSSDTVFVHRAGVVQSISEPGIYAGIPTQPLSEYKKNFASYRGLAKMKRRLLGLEKKLSELLNR